MRFARVVCAGLLVLAGSAAAQDGGKTIQNETIQDGTIQNTTISLGTATPGGGFPLYGNAFAEAMNAADPTFAIQPRNTKASAHLCRFTRRFQQQVCPFIVRQTALEIAIHDGEIGAGFLKLGQVMVRPIPQPDTKTHFL